MTVKSYLKGALPGIRDQYMCRVSLFATLMHSDDKVLYITH